MPKINEKEYEVLQALDDKWKYLARNNMYGAKLEAHTSRPYKMTDSHWSNGDMTLELLGGEHLFQFIQWEDEKPYNIQELIDEYESEYHIESASIVNIDVDKITGSVHQFDESEESEVKKNIEWLRRKVLDNKFMGHTIHIDVLFELMDQLDEPEPKNISLQDVTHRLWGLALNDRKYWLEKLNDEFQEGYVVPLGLKTTDGKEQYLTLSGSYFACRRNEHLQQTFSTLEEIPEFYRDLAVKVI